MVSRAHWDSIYTSKAPTEVSWYQERPTVSAGLIAKVAPARDAAILDVGGGASTLVDALLSLGYSRLTVTDIAAPALDHAKQRLGSAAAQAEWRCADVLDDGLADDAIDVWHDRAVFHFLTSPEHRTCYRRQAARVVRPGGYLIVATFADDGPQRCSGLPVSRYTADALYSEFATDFDLVESIREEHVTPSGARQNFQYCVCMKPRKA